MADEIKENPTANNPSGEGLPGLLKAKGTISLAFEKDQGILPSSRTAQPLSNDRTFLFPPAVNSQETELQKKIFELENRLKYLEKFINDQETRFLSKSNIFSKLDSVPSADKNLPFKKLSASRLSTLFRSNKILLPLIVAVVFVSAAGAVFYYWPHKIYEAAAKIILENREAQPGFIPEKDLMRYLSSGSVITKIVEKVEALPADQIKKQERIKILFQEYRKNLKMEWVGAHNYINIHFLAKDRALASTVVKEFVNVGMGIKNISAILIKQENNLRNIVQALNAAPFIDRAIEVDAASKADLDKLLAQEISNYEQERNNLQSQFEALKANVKSENNSIEKNPVVAALKLKLIELEFQKLYLEKKYMVNDVVLVTHVEKISIFKSKMANLIKSFWKGSLTPKQEETSALMLKEIFLDAKLSAFSILVNKQYGQDSYLSSRQKEYVMNMRGLSQSLERYQESFQKYEDMLAALQNAR